MTGDRCSECLGAVSAISNVCVLSPVVVNVLLVGTSAPFCRSGSRHRCSATSATSGYLVLHGDHQARALILGPVVARAELDASDVEVALKVNLPPVASCGASSVEAVAVMRAEALSGGQRSRGSSPR